ncbi:hypothetical protein ABK040_009455 [Willaertia magna]
MKDSFTPEDDNNNNFNNYQQDDDGYNQQQQQIDNNVNEEEGSSFNSKNSQSLLLENNNYGNYENEKTKKSLFRKVFIFLDYPIATWFIILNELCERFAFYGFKTILALYLKDFLRIDEDVATGIVHAFVFLAYFTPLVGGFLADAIFGKYWTILMLSVVYCIGQTVISVTAIPGVTGSVEHPHWWGAALGLVLVAIGTGGIKSSVSTMGGDQFDPEKPNTPELLSSFFSLFYFSINIGSTVSSFTTPIIRSAVGYWVAFLIPAVLLFVATFIFGIGKCFYRHVKPTGLKNNPVFGFLYVVYCAIRGTIRKRSGMGPREETSALTFDRLPNSGNNNDNYQATTITTTNNDNNNENANNNNTIVLTNESGDSNNNNNSGSEEEDEEFVIDYSKEGPRFVDNAVYWNNTFTQSDLYDIKCILRVCVMLLPIVIFWSLFDQHSSRFVFQAENMDRRIIYLGPSANNTNNDTVIVTDNFNFVNFPSVFLLPVSSLLNNDKQSFLNNLVSSNTFNNNNTNSTDRYLELGADQVTAINPILVILLVIVFDRIIYPAIPILFKIKLTLLRRIGAGMVITSLSFVCAAILEVFVTQYPKEIHVAWQLPQYIFLSVGEILVSVSGIEFAYSQAPMKMKSLMQAYYLLMVSMGNIIVVIVALLPLPKWEWRQVVEFSFFAFLMLLGLGLHLIMSMRYQYRKQLKK